MTAVEYLKKQGEKLITLVVGISTILTRLEKAGELDAIPRDIQADVDGLIRFARRINAAPLNVDPERLSEAVSWALKYGRGLERLERDGILRVMRKRIALLESEIYEQKKNGLEHAFASWSLVRSIGDIEGAKEYRSTFELLLKAAEEDSAALRIRRVRRESGITVRPERRKLARAS